MSEPSQLYIEVKLGRDAFNRFQAHQIANPSNYGDWQDWLSQHRYYGAPDETVDRAVSNHSPGFVIEAVLDAWMESADEYTGPILNRYDDATKTWTFAVVMFSENFGEILDTLNCLRQIDAYKDIDSDDYCAVFPYFFGRGFEEAEALMKFTRGKSEFTAAVPDWFRQRAEAAIEKLATDAGAND
ncbi:hypothetical protein [Burkholderia ubonensis]|uniref:Uncharacterized protein n=1 Tax=Burkholderia ubonensis TaxID=101571 RepID=A0A1R1J8G4_9BURK|nr:hypothetical protein [Burkholderia ubonensis]OMG71576.1 hypothetical protein BW685_20460 [Burkholderia ubonensis]